MGDARRGLTTPWAIVIAAVILVTVVGALYWWASDPDGPTSETGGSKGRASTCEKWQEAYREVMEPFFDPRAGALFPPQETAPVKALLEDRPDGCHIPKKRFIEERYPSPPLDEL